MTKNTADDLVHAVVAPMVWVFGYIDGWGSILQLWAIGFASVAAWEIRTGDTCDPRPEDED